MRKFLLRLLASCAVVFCGGVVFGMVLLPFPFWQEIARLAVLSAVLMAMLACVVLIWCPK